MDDASLFEKKAAARRSVLTLRDEMDEQCRHQASMKAANWALSAIGILLHDCILSQSLPRKTIGLFWPIRSEIDCLVLHDTLRCSGFDVALPKVLGKSDLEFRRWDEGAGLSPAGFGTCAPEDGAEIVIPDLLLVPLVAFDRERHRLGYGAGYYDRYIAGLEQSGRKPLLIGYAFETQMLDKVPVGRYDQRLDFIVTDAGLI